MAHQDSSWAGEETEEYDYDVPPTSVRKNDDTEDDDLYVNISSFKPSLPAKSRKTEDVDANLGIKPKIGEEVRKPTPAPRKSIAGRARKSSQLSSDGETSRKSDSNRGSSDVDTVAEKQKPTPAPRIGKKPILSRESSATSLTIAGVTKSSSLDYDSEEELKQSLVAVQQQNGNGNISSPDSLEKKVLAPSSPETESIADHKYLEASASVENEEDKTQDSDNEDEDDYMIMTRQNEVNDILEANANAANRNVAPLNEPVRLSGEYSEPSTPKLKPENYDNSPDDYMPVWIMTTGAAPVAKVENGPVVMRPPSELITFTEGKTNTCTESDKMDMTSSLSRESFYSPPPNFAPPPLPPHIHDPAIPDHPTTTQGKIPPAVPPRPQTITPHSSVISSQPSKLDRDSFGQFADSRVKGQAQRTPPAVPQRHPPSENVYCLETHRGSIPPPLPEKPQHLHFIQDSSPIYEFEQISNDPQLDESISSAADQSILWESDDTLSDGGDFVEDLDINRHIPLHSKSSIPIIPAAQSSITERKGYLFKHSSSGSRRRGWTKRYVSFDGKYLTYFADSKSVVSKRMIPVSTLINVEQIQNADVHPYQFKVYTIDRVYIFAAVDSDDLTIWTSLLMSSILSQKDEEFKEGGEMFHPEKQGELRMEGVKGMRYVAIKKDKFAYYNTQNDYKAGCPIYIIDMKLASVKDLGRHKLQLITGFAKYNLQFDSMDVLLSWKQAIEGAIAEGLADDKVLNQVYENCSNKFCADCGGPDPHWASVNLIVTLCQNCAGVHRMLNTPLSKIRSLRMDQKVWTPQLIELMKKVGNDSVNHFWEWNTTEDDRIDSDADMVCRRDFIIAKYEEKRFIRYHPLHTDQEALNQALYKAAQYSDVMETLQLIFSGAEICYKFQGKTPLQLAQKANQTLQMEFLQQNGGDCENDSMMMNPATAIAHKDSRHLYSISHKGYLYKTGSNLKEFLKRWCVLDQGTLAYYENDKGTTPKDRIEKREMLSIMVTTYPDDKYQFSFELATTKYGGRVYLFAADSEEEREKWVINLAKTFTCIPPRLHEHLREMEKGGNVYVRHGAIKSWHKRWIHLKRKTLYVYKEDARHGFEEFDLRKVMSIKDLQLRERCLETFDDGPPFVIDLPNKAVYIQGDSRKETESWLQVLQKLVQEGGGMRLEDQQLTADEVPVIVDKCINFISTQGLKHEGLYRLSGQHSKVTQLLDDFIANARGVHLSQDDMELNIVATVLKRFFRSLEEPLLTHKLYQKWIETSENKDHTSKMQWYKYLLGELPAVHKNTLKRVITHLARVADFEKENKMSIMNIGSIFGPVLMSGDQGSGYGSTNQEIGVVMDLLLHHRTLFEVGDEELEQERKMQDALEKIKQAEKNIQQSSAHPESLILGVYINSKNGEVITHKVPPYMTAEGLLEHVQTKAHLDPSVNWGLFEIICNGQIERALHFSENVLEVTLKWSTWPEEFRRDNHLCVKNNFIFEKVEAVFDPHYSLFTELRYSEKKGFKKFCFDFGQFKLSYHKDNKVGPPLGSWQVEDLTVYIGTEAKRAPPTKHSFTFISSKDTVVKTKDSPFFGHAICCNTAEELYRWVAAILHAQHPEGLTQGCGPLAAGSGSQEVRLPMQEFDGRGSGPSRIHRQKQSFIQRFINKR